MIDIKRGEIYLANLGNSKHTDIGKIRPVLIFQNDLLNKMISENLYDEVVIVPLSTKIRNNDFTLNIKKRDSLKEDSSILCNAVKMINVKRLQVDKGVLTKLDSKEIVEVEKRLKLLLAL